MVVRTQKSGNQINPPTTEERDFDGDMMGARVVKDVRGIIYERRDIHS